jgi:acetyl esterase/lipase
MDHEGHDMAAWFNAQGITYAVLKYRMPNEHHEVPLSDALQAIRLVRKHAEEWNIEKVGIMGSSAGGHLASTAATHYTDDSRPDFQILFYPVISMDLSICHKGSRERLIGKIPTDELVQLYSNELQVSAQTPPAFIMHSSDDRVVPVENSLRYYQALVKNKVPASLHCYPTGGHGWGYNDNFKYKRQWTGELEKWLREL